ncbi:MAG: arginine--tRNA ligase [Deltaproteobacteria bacterium]|jgi:arginyl-tRNA synthetase|nr:arginine--tRNA ligase [Deltaproteobacteria bacterium]
MKDKIRDLVSRAVQAAARQSGLLEDPDLLRFSVERPANPEFGDFSANAALVYSRDFQRADPSLKGRKLAALLIDLVSADASKDLFAEISAAGPGFINFKLSPGAWQGVLREIRAAGAKYGAGEPTGRRILLEFVSSNPTGPLHVGHGRGAAWGDAMGNILSFLGDEVEREYYVNDAGNQINTLGESLLYRLKNPEPDAEPPEGLYRGLYILDVLNEIKINQGEDFFRLPEPELKERLSLAAADLILEDMKKDLARFKVRFDHYFSEKSLYQSGQVDQAIESLRKAGHLYEKDGALFFRSTDFGDDKDRVLVKGGGDHTYFASDVAYHRNKCERGFHLLVDVLGADHGGYSTRVAAAMEALGYDPKRLKMVLYQLVRLRRGAEILKMSTRAGEFVPLKLVLDEVSPDAARFLYLTQSHDSALDFDLEVAKAKNNDNPAYYVQYLAARIFQVKNKALSVFGELPEPEFSLLTEKEELALISRLSGFPELLRLIGDTLQPHLLTGWLIETARLFHHYYGGFRMVAEDAPALSAARVELAWTVREVVGRGLELLGAAAPERM